MVLLILHCIVYSEVGHSGVWLVDTEMRSHFAATDVQNTMSQQSRVIQIAFQVLGILVPSRRPLRLPGIRSYQVPFHVQKSLLLLLLPEEATENRVIIHALFFPYKSLRCCYFCHAHFESADRGAFDRSRPGNMQAERHPRCITGSGNGRDAMVRAQYFALHKLSI